MLRSAFLRLRRHGSRASIALEREQSNEEVRHHDHILSGEFLLSCIHLSHGRSYRDRNRSTNFSAILCAEFS